MWGCPSTLKEALENQPPTSTDAGVLDPFEIPRHFPAIEFPEDNPPSLAKHELGRHLFFDFRLSVNGTRACGICHEPKKGWTDGFIRSLGATDEMVSRNSLSVVNVAYRDNLTWRNPDVHLLEEQLLTPLLGTDPIEMGMPEQETMLIARFEETDFYPQLFENAFPGEAMNYGNIAKAIANFERTIVSGRSPYDAFLNGDEEALSLSAQKGKELFFGPKLKCGHCHSGLFLDSPTDDAGNITARHGYYNTGLYDIDGAGSYPPEEIGLKKFTGLAEDMGVFRVPSLRNVMATGPYAHDGTAAEVDHLITAYARGGRWVQSGQYAGDGALNPFRSELITGFDLSDEERQDLLAFLEALTDEYILAPTHLRNPFCEEDSEGTITNAPCKPRFEVE